MITIDKLFVLAGVRRLLFPDKLLNRHSVPDGGEHSGFLVVSPAIQLVPQAPDWGRDVEQAPFPET
jgi:hypothetical protein